MSRAYLDEVGHPEIILDEKTDSRNFKWEEQRDFYGFDERETWALDHAFYCWLYERLRAYVDWCCVNLDFHKFEYRGQIYTQQQLIDMMLERLRFYFENGDNDWSLTEEQLDYIHEIEYIWATCLMSMWW